LRAWRAETMTELHEKVCQQLVHSPVEKLDIVSSVDVQIHNAMAEAMTMQWDFDLKTMWLTPSRWSMMCRQYIDPEQLELFIEKITSKMGPKGRGIAALRTNIVKPRGGKTNKETRRWGSCMLAITYKSQPAPQITLYSRTSYLGYLGALDMTVAWVVGRYVAEALGLKMDEIRFVWYNEAMQFHNFKSLAYLFNSIDEEKRAFYHRALVCKKDELTREEKKLIVASPALKLSRNWMQRIVKEDEEGKTYGDMSYNTYRRIRRRYHTEVYGLEHARQFEGFSHFQERHRKRADFTEVGDEWEWYKAYLPLPSTPVSTLDFSKLGLPLKEVSGLVQPYEGDDIDDEDDEE
jgi:hypothetical protein